MIEVLRIAAGVATPLGLLGLIAALAYFAYSRQLKSREKELTDLPAEERSNQVDSQLSRYGIDAKNATREQKFKMIMDEMEKRYQLARFYAILAAIIFAFCFSIATFSTTLEASRAAHAALSENTSLRSKLANFEADQLRKEKELRDKVVTIMDEYNKTTLNLHTLIVMRASDSKSDMGKYSESLKTSDHSEYWKFEHNHQSLEYAIMEAILKKDYFKALENGKKMKASINAPVALEIEKLCGTNPVRRLFGKLDEPLLSRLEKLPDQDLRAFIQLFEY